MPLESIEWLVGTAFVLYHAFIRFNDPPSSRSNTTAGRYYTAATVYCLSMLAVFLLLARVPDALRYFTSDVKQPIEGLSPPLVAALIVTVLLPKIPPLVHFDDWIRSFLHDIASIPLEAVLLSQKLHAAELKTDKQTKQRVADWLKSAGFSEEDLVFGERTSPQGLWMRVSILRHTLDNWKTQDRKLASFHRDFKADFKIIEKRFDLLSTRAQHLFSLLALDDRSLESRATRAIEGMVRDFKAELTDLEKEVCKLISRGVLTCRLTRKAREKELKNLGLSIPQPTLQLFDRGVLVFILLSIIAELFCIGGLIVNNSSDEPLSAEIVLRVIVFGLILALIFTFSLAVGIYFRYKAGDSGGSGAGRRWSNYLLGGLLSCAVSGVLIFLFSLLCNRIWLAEDWTIVVLWPLAFLGWITGLASGFHVDTTEERTKIWYLGEIRTRWLEAMIQGFCTVVIAVAAVWMMEVMARAWPNDFPPKSSLWLLTFVSGGVIGLMVPHGIRRARYEEEGVTEEGESVEGKNKSSEEPSKTDRAGRTTREDFFVWSVTGKVYHYPECKVAIKILDKYRTEGREPPEGRHLHSGCPT